MPEKTAYKVGRKDGDGWKSAIVTGKACVSYHLGARSYGFEGTPVTVFLSEDDANRFKWGGEVVLCGQVGNPRPQENLATWWEGGFLTAMRRFWERGDQYQGQTFQAPKGTHAADWFEPEKVVSR